MLILKVFLCRQTWNLFNKFGEWLYSIFNSVMFIPFVARGDRSRGVSSGTGSSFTRPRRETQTSFAGNAAAHQASHKTRQSTTQETAHTYSTPVSHPTTTTLPSAWLYPAVYWHRMVWEVLPQLQWNSECVFIFKSFWIFFIYLILLSLHCIRQSLFDP